MWASWEGCLEDVVFHPSTEEEDHILHPSTEEDVVFLLSTGVEVNTRGQVRLRESDTVRSMHIM